jgi:hypothetical protein
VPAAGAVLSYMSGTVHPYYSLSLAPAVAGLFALGVHQMWTLRAGVFGRLGLAALLLATGGWGVVLVHRTGGWHPELRWAVLISTVLAAVLLALPWEAAVLRRVTAVALAVGLIGGLAGPAAYTAATLATRHNGGSPSVGPARADGRGDWGRTQSTPQLAALLSATHSTWAAAIDGSSQAAALELASNRAVMAIGGFTGSDPTPTLAQFQADVQAGAVRYYIVMPNGRGGGGHDHDQHADISTWVRTTFTPRTVGTATVYDLAD